jgi:protein O-GlcNAc transferase
MLIARCGNAGVQYIHKPIAMSYTEEIERAITCHRAGQLEQAESLYLLVLGQQPGHPDANHNLGVLEVDRNAPEKSLPYFVAALEVSPVEQQYWLSYIRALMLAGQMDTAKEVMLLGKQHGLEGAEVVTIETQLSRITSGDCEQNIAYLSSFHIDRQYDQVEFVARVISKIYPSHEYPCKLLGNLYYKQGRYLEAERIFSKVVDIAPYDFSNHYNLGNAQQQLGKITEAIVSYNRVIELNPAFAQAYNNLGNMLWDQHFFDAAIDKYRKAIELNPEYAEAFCNLGLALSDYDGLEEAIHCYQQALKLRPDYQDAFDNLLFCMNYLPDISQEALFSEYQAFDKQFGHSTDQPPLVNANLANPEKRLKVGYVAPCFKLHPCRHFLEPLLVNHDKSKVEIYAYDQLPNSDAVAFNYRSYVDHWIVTRGMTDDELAEQIRADGIDILVDIAGHTGHNRLQVFARKPAPVSLHWLDFGYTTGLKAIDYYLTDEQTVPEGSEHLFSETPWRLPVPAYAYRPAEGMGEVSGLPARQRGYVTFGTLTRAVRINHRSIRVWSEILKAVPGSHLVINSVSFSNPEMQKRMMERFTEHGITHERLEIGMTSPPWDVLRGIDIGLDCFPHNSGTTLFETLYMGIPFVTLASRPSVGRLGASILHGLGHPEWIAETEEEYISKAVALAGDLDKLAGLRSVLRQEMERSPLMDEVGFARAVEDAYRQMWERWCATTEFDYPAVR